MDWPTLETLLHDWSQRLRGWALSGALSRAARDALQLDGEPQLLRQLVARWSEGLLEDLPPIKLLPAASMPGAAGAYALSTGTIYLNADWLQRASQEQALAVLTEELGHHLDGLLNRSDTPGDEGELFAGLLLSGGVIRERKRLTLRAEDDRGRVLVAGRELEVEQAVVGASTPFRSVLPGRTCGEFQSLGAFAALKSDGSVVTWGSSLFGGDSSGVASQLRSGVEQIFSNCYAFAALKSDGSVVTWGYSLYGGDSSAVSSQLSSNVKQVYSNEFAFAALKSDGSVVSWGDAQAGGDSSAVASQLRSGVRQIFSTDSAFAALKSDGSVVTWGEPFHGGDSSAVSSLLSSGVVQIFPTSAAFAVLKSDGSVVSWGAAALGGDSGAVASQLSSGVMQIFSTLGAFAALKSDGSVVTWVDHWFGGDSSAVASQLRSGVMQVFSNEVAFAALKSDGSVVTWGRPRYGGDSSAVVSQLYSGVKQIFSTEYAFAALKNDGSVVSWGEPTDGGDSSAVASQLSSGVEQIFSTTWGAFAALKNDGSVVTWGNTTYGGDSSAVASQLRSGVKQIFSTLGAFSALKSDGSVVSWGASSNGGDSSAVASQLLSNVVAFANPFTYDRLIAEPIASITSIADNFGLIQGNVADNGFTDDRTPTISGKLAAPLASGETIGVWNGSKLLGTATVNNAALSWSFTAALPGPVADGTSYILTARLESISGTLGAASAPRSFTLDRTAPSTTAEITTLNDDIGIVQGAIAHGGRTDDRTPTLRGTISASLLSGETVRIFNGTTLLGTAKVDNTAKIWSFKPTLPQPSAGGSNYTITARVADAAGNLGAASSARTFTLSPTLDLSINTIQYSGLDGKNQPFKMMDHNTGLVSERLDGIVRFRASGSGGLTNSLPTYVYAHGWKDSFDSANAKLLFDKLTATLRGTANVVLVDWSSLAKEWPIKLNPATTWVEPLSEATVTKQVGETVADALIRAGAAIDKITLIGHSLGSFVMASAANEIAIRTGVKVKELVALDAVSSPSGYDIDARNGSMADPPFPCAANLATTTTSYTVSDLNEAGAIVGDNARAATAQNSYLVQYVKSSYPANLAAAAPADLHHGVVGIYADLFAKNALHPSSVLINDKPVLNSLNSFDRDGKPNANGLFDGVIVAAQPWTWRSKFNRQIATFKAPKAIGWAESYRDPIIYGSNAADVMFFDQFMDAGGSSWLMGRDGNDWLVGGKTDGIGIDRLTGGNGSDEFWFGYQRYARLHFPYLDKNDITGYGGGAFAVVTDFNRKQDFLRFAWDATQITRKSGAQISDSLTSTYGAGVGFLHNNDLIAYVPGLTLAQVDTLIANTRISFGQVAQLDSALLA
jgi:alpha-tubulin suppressor-like RCC1 family protein/pimeloyl-ACP methyl ester carboxylesterase